jgi:hypothetical protein
MYSKSFKETRSVKEQGKAAAATGSERIDQVEAERKHRRETLILVRSQVSQQLQNARSVAHRQSLHLRLRSIDADLEALGGNS